MTKVSRRLNRILLMLPFIITRDGVSVSELCEEFDIGRQELMSDLHMLQMCGLPAYTPADLIDFWIDGYSVHIILADYFKRPLNLTRQEAVTLFVAGSALTRSGVFEAGGPLGSALEKVGRLLSAEEKADIKRMTERIDVEMSAYTGRWKEILEEGLQKRRALAIEYFSYSRDDLNARDVDPLSLVWSRGYWYLLAWCHQAEDTRLFRLDRIKSVSMTGKAVELEPRALNLPELVGEYRPGRRAHQVKLTFSGREGRRLVEEWPTARVTDEAEGKVAVELRTKNLEWLSTYLLRFGERVEIHSPKELRKMVRDRATRLLEEYS